MKKKVGWRLIILLIMICLVSCFPYSEVYGKTKLNVNKVTLYVGQTKQLKVSGATKVKWSTNKKSVATVSKKGLVTAKKPGKATVIAKTTSKKIKCEVIVKKPILKLSNGSKNILQIGEKTLLKTNGWKVKANTFRTSDKSIVTVNKKGVVVAKKTGTANLTAQIKGTKKKVSCKVTVVEEPQNQTIEKVKEVVYQDSVMNLSESTSGTYELSTTSEGQLVVSGNMFDKGTYQEGDVVILPPNSQIDSEIPIKICGKNVDQSGNEIYEAEIVTNVFDVYKDIQLEGSVDLLDVYADKTQLCSVQDIKGYELDRVNGNIRIDITDELTSALELDTDASNIEASVTGSVTLSKLNYDIDLHGRSDNKNHIRLDIDGDIQYNIKGSFTNKSQKYELKKLRKDHIKLPKGFRANLRFFVVVNDITGEMELQSSISYDMGIELQSQKITAIHEVNSIPDQSNKKMEAEGGIGLMLQAGINWVGVEVAQIIAEELQFLSKEDAEKSLITCNATVCLNLSCSETQWQNGMTCDDVRMYLSMLLNVGEGSLLEHIQFDKDIYQWDGKDSPLLCYHAEYLDGKGGPTADGKCSMKVVRGETFLGLTCKIYEDGTCWITGRQTEDSSWGNTSENIKATYTNAPWYGIKQKDIKSIYADYDACGHSQEAMFYNAYNIESFRTGSNFNTTGVKNMGNMFQDCSSLKELDLSHIDTSNVTDMGQMFDGCGYGHELTMNLSAFNTQNVTDMSHMFMLCGCRELDLRSFDTARVKNMMEMFSGSRWLEHIYVSSWSKKNLSISKDMFFGCDSLPNYDRSKKDEEMAYVGGYFEWKN